MSELVHKSIFHHALRTPDAAALSYREQTWTYHELAQAVSTAAAQLLECDLQRLDRIAIYLEKRLETVAAIFGASAAGGVFVPVNPLLKAEQVAYILQDCNVRVLVTSAERLRMLSELLPRCTDLHTILVVDAIDDLQVVGHFQVKAWNPKHNNGLRPHRNIDGDMAAILYTSGSTGKPKGVVLSHRNLCAGAASVASYLENCAQDRILCVLPLSFDYGLSQLTTAFHVGGAAVLMNYLLPRDIPAVVESQQITGLAAVPALWMQLASQKWPTTCKLRYLTNSGGAMPQATLAQLRSLLPSTKIYLMYGLTEAFRSTFLPPEELGRRPDSIGKAIPNAEIMVVRQDGTPCATDEPGELVHRGALVSLGYWNDAVKTAERFKPVPQAVDGLPLQEIAVWSGDTVRYDAEGFLYFVGRNDDMIKVSGYRISPTEVEEVIIAHAGVAEAAAFGVPHPTLGQAIVVALQAKDGAQLSASLLLDLCRRQLPAYMVPAHIDIRPENLPRNPNGKFDRKALQAAFSGFFTEASKHEH